MTKSRSKQLAIIAIALAALALAALVALPVATRVLKSQVENALGPDSEIGEIVLGWSAVEIRELRIRARSEKTPGWPTEDTLRARRIVVEPDLRSLISARIRIHRITVDDAYISILRARDGRLRLLPSLLETPGRQAENANAPPPSVAIGSVEINNGVLDFFDATVHQPAHRIRLVEVHAGIDKLQVPDLAGRTQLQLDGIIKGVQRDGKFSLRGWAELASKDSETTTRLHGVDLVALQPYLIKAAETGVKKGSLDLELKSAVKNKHLHAPGTITLSDLEIASTGSGFGTFMGMPRQAVVAALKNHNNQIALHFVLEGNLNDPQFSLNESLSKRIGTSVAEGLGVSIEGLARGAGSAAQGMGSAIKKLFGK